MEIANICVLKLYVSHNNSLDVRLYTFIAINLNENTFIQLLHLILHFFYVYNFISL